ncbi:hypothetical protein [Bifidobacterium kimbladii]|uniref:Uncharacterized protein n=1 Tax=Bifidobacterium asteroides TaxID=1684 RepID=A0A0F4L147_9BIFI|nr:hypothetical protein [Bifidobacterium asteroides]KJY52597.1 hypothetical protein JF69_02900 [Bifidobacterium asteroides]
MLQNKSSLLLTYPQLRQLHIEHNNAYKFSLPFQGYRNEGQNLGFKSGVLRRFKFSTMQDQHPAGKKQYVVFFGSFRIGGEYCLGNGSNTGIKKTGPALISMKLEG